MTQEQTNINAGFLRLTQLLKLRTGNLASLTTASKVDLVSAINEIRANVISNVVINDLSSSTNVVYSSFKVNQLLDTKINVNGSYTNPSWLVSLPVTKITGLTLNTIGAASATDLGTLALLNTIDKTSTVSAINELFKSKRLFNNSTELESYTGTESIVSFTDGRQYILTTSSTTVDHITSLSVSGQPSKKWLLEADNKINVKWFGAKGDGVTDDTAAFIAAFKSNRSVLIPATADFYKISDFVNLININKLTINATNAKIYNIDKTKPTWLFRSCSDISITGGEWGYTQTITANGGNNQHVFQIDQSQRVMIDGIYITGSPEMGVAITNSINVTVKNSRIENTWRDGTYSHYSANVQYINNRYKNIKDDAMSFHDYGVDADKAPLIAFGFPFAKNCLMKDNIVDSTYQGVGSIAADTLTILNNKISNTVIAGIAVFNSKELTTPGTALVKNVLIDGNELTNNGSSVTILGTIYNNNGQSSTGRGALFVGSLGTNNQLNMGETKRLSNIVISNNIIRESKSQGFISKLVDGLTFNNNTFINMAGPTSVLSGDVIEINESTNFSSDNNTFIDTRTTPLHQHIWSLYNVTGQRGTSFVNQIAISEYFLNGTVKPDLYLDKFGVINTSAINIDSNGSVNFNSIIKAGVYQVSGSAISTTINFPIGLTNAGNLFVAVSNDVVTQLYFDNVGNFASRTLNGYHASTTWSAWNYTMTTLTKAGVPIAAEIPTNGFRIVRNTTAGNIKIYFNDNGTLTSTQLT